MSNNNNNSHRYWLRSSVNNDNNDNNDDMNNRENDNNDTESDTDNEIVNNNNDDIEEDDDSVNSYISITGHRNNYYSSDAFLNPTHQDRYPTVTCERYSVGNVVMYGLQDSATGKWWKADVHYARYRRVLGGWKNLPGNLVAVTR
jgi:hypothetical protein